MKKGYFAHQLCCGRSLLNKHILYLSADKQIETILPFQREVSLTTFCEGLLLVVATTFARHRDEFVAELTRQLQAAPDLTVGEAVLHNSVYRRNSVSDDEECSLYAITSIDWQTCRLRNEDNITLMEIAV